MWPQIEIIPGDSHSGAIADGFLVDVSYWAKQYRIDCPVFATSAVWNTYMDWNPKEDDYRQTGQDLDGRVFDVVCMLEIAFNWHFKRERASDTFFFKVSSIPRDGHSKISSVVQLKAVLGTDANNDLFLTIMLPIED